MNTLIVGTWVEQIVPRWLDVGDGLGYIRIWAILPRRLVFWDGVPSPSFAKGDRKEGLAVVGFAARRK